MDGWLADAVLLIPVVLLTLAVLRSVLRDGFDGVLMLGACGLLWFFAIDAIRT